MGAKRDPLDLLDAVYAFHKAESVWVRDIVRAFVPFSLGGGAFAYVGEMAPRMLHRSAHFETDVVDESLLQVCGPETPQLFWNRLHAPTPTTTLPAVLAAACRELGLAPESFGDLLRFPPMWSVVGGDAGREAFLIALPCAAGTRMPPALRRTFDCMGAHLGASLRLRSVVEGAPSTDHPSVEAILGADGRVLEMRGTATGKRGALVDAALRMDRARTSRASAEERLTLWQALCEGRWSFVETVERDGKRMLLACKNAPRVSGLRKLTSSERSVVAFAALGHAYKYIGYELGLSVPAIARHVERALRKLGLASRWDLIRLFGSTCIGDANVRSLLQPTPSPRDRPSGT